MTPRDPAQLHFYELRNRAVAAEERTVTRVDGVVTYLGRDWAFYRLLVPVTASQTAPQRFRTYIGLIERAGTAADAPLRVRGAACETRTAPAERGAGLLELDSWPHDDWRLPLPLIAIGREQALKWRRITEYWRTYDFIYLNEPLLADVRAADSGPAELAPEEAQGFRCGECGQWHEGQPLAFLSLVPDAWFDVPREEWASRVWLSGEGCHIDGRSFVRARLQLPILDGPHPFDLRLWCEVGPDDFAVLTDRWFADGRTRDPPRPARLANELPAYPHSLGLSCEVYFAPDGITSIRVLDERHSLASDQRDGITLERASRLMH